MSRTTVYDHFKVKNAQHGPVIRSFNGHCGGYGSFSSDSKRYTPGKLVYVWICRILNSNDSVTKCNNPAGKPGMKDLWVKIAGLFAFIVTILGLALSLFNKGKKAATDEIKAETEAEAREYEKAGEQAMIAGLTKEGQKADEETDIKRRHFH